MIADGVFGGAEYGCLPIYIGRSLEVCVRDKKRTYVWPVARGAIEAGNRERLLPIPSGSATLRQVEKQIAGNERLLMRREACGVPSRLSETCDVNLPSRTRFFFGASLSESIALE